MEEQEWPEEKKHDFIKIALTCTLFITRDQQTSAKSWQTLDPIYLEQLLTLPVTREYLSSYASPIEEHPLIQLIGNSINFFQTVDNEYMVYAHTRDTSTQREVINNITRKTLQKIQLLLSTIPVEHILNIRATIIANTSIHFLSPLFRSYDFDTYEGVKQIIAFYSIFKVELSKARTLDTFNKFLPWRMLSFSLNEASHLQSEDDQTTIPEKLITAIQFSMRIFVQYIDSIPNMNLKNNSIPPHLPNLITATASATSDNVPKRSTLTTAHELHSLLNRLFSPVGSINLTKFKESLKKYSHCMQDILKNPTLKKYHDFIKHIMNEKHSNNSRSQKNTHVPTISAIFIVLHYLTKKISFPLPGGWAQISSLIVFDLYQKKPEMALHILQDYLIHLPKGSQNVSEFIQATLNTLIRYDFIFIQGQHIIRLGNNQLLKDFLNIEQVKSYLAIQNDTLQQPKHNIFYEIVTIYAYFIQQITIVNKDQTYLASNINYETWRQNLKAKISCLIPFMIESTTPLIYQLILQPTYHDILFSIVSTLLHLQDWNPALIALAESIKELKIEGLDIWDDIQIYLSKKLQKPIDHEPANDLSTTLSLLDKHANKQFKILVKAKRPPTLQSKRMQSSGTAMHLKAPISTQQAVAVDSAAASSATVENGANCSKP